MPLAPVHAAQACAPTYVFVKVFTDDDTGSWLGEDIPSTITLEELRGHLYTGMPCLKPYLTAHLEQSVWLLERGQRDISDYVLSAD